MLSFPLMPLHGMILITRAPWSRVEFFECLALLDRHRLASFLVGFNRPVLIPFLGSLFRVSDPLSGVMRFIKFLRENYLVATLGQDIMPFLAELAIMRCAIEGGLFAL